MYSMKRGYPSPCHPPLAMATIERPAPLNSIHAEFNANNAPIDPDKVWEYSHEATVYAAELVSSFAATVALERQYRVDPLLPADSRDSVSISICSPSFHHDIEFVEEGWSLVRLHRTLRAHSLWPRSGLSALLQ